MSALARPAAAALSAVAVGLAFPPVHADALAWIALAPLLAALRGAGPRAALLLPWGWTLLGAWVIGSWMPDAVAHYFLQPRALGHAFFFAVATGMAAVFYMAFGRVYAALAGRLAPAALPWAAAAAWVAAELGRARLFTAVAFVSNPWGLLAYSQLERPAAVQVASLTGAYGTSFAMAALAAGLAEAGAQARAGARRAALAALASGAAPAALVLGFGALSLRAAPPPQAPAPPDAVRIALVQGDVDLGTRWRSDFYGQNLDVYLAGTREALAAAPGALVLWPEGALTFFLADEPLYVRAIARVLAAGDGELLVGGPRRDGGEPPRFFNSVFRVDAAGRLGEPYDKQHLVPFTEYPPLARLDFVRRRFEGVRFFSHGAPSPPLATRAGPAGILLCNEAMLPDVAGRRAREGAAFLAVPSNDTWIASRSFAEPLFDIVRLRAVEQRRWLVRASTSGPSAIVDPWGRVQARSEPFERAVVTGWIRPERALSPYARIGDAFAFACAAAVPWALWRARRRPGGGGDQGRAASRGIRPATR